MKYWYTVGGEGAGHDSALVSLGVCIECVCVGGGGGIDRKGTVEGCEQAPLACQKTPNHVTMLEETMHHEKVKHSSLLRSWGDPRESAKNE